MRQRIMLIAALMHDPEVVTLDEPFSGLDVISTMILTKNDESSAVARKIILTVLLVVASVFAWGWMTALLHAGFVLALSMLLIETLLVGFRKIPFTCSFSPFRNNVVVLALVVVLGYFFFTGSGASVEHWMMLRPLRFLWLVPGAAVAWDVLRRIRNEIPRIDTCLFYREQTAAVVQPLNLFGN